MRASLSLRTGAPMHEFLKSLYRRSMRLALRKPSRTVRRAPLQLEGLEHRCVPAAYVSFGQLVVDGTSAADTCSIGLTTVNNVSTYRVTLNSVVSDFAASSVTSNLAYFYGNDSGDTL